MQNLRSATYTIGMDIEFDAAKHAGNMATHGLSLAAAAMIDLLTGSVSADDR